MHEPARLLARSAARRVGAAAKAVVAVSCAVASAQGLGLGPTPSRPAAAEEDGLADAYALFKSVFVGTGFDRDFPVGYGYHPALSTEKLVNEEGRTPKGTAILSFDAEGSVSARLHDAPDDQDFDLWFVKNVAGAGRTIKPEAGDQFFKVGSFAASSFGKALSAKIGGNVAFDLDLLVVTRKGQHPAASRIAVGARTLFEKRFFRERVGERLDPVSGTVAANVETADQLVGRGAQLFFNERFGGNGRTCATCHRPENNLTIDPAFIAGLPPNDPLFVAETNPDLKKLENSTLLRRDGLILENVDGFDAPTRQFVLRGVPHLLAVSLTNDIQHASDQFPLSPPDHRLGWGGDGAPGRGTLNEFAAGAIFQHFPRTLARRPGADFRLPSQEEVDALEAFQLFGGRQRLVEVEFLKLRDARAERGRILIGPERGQCVSCHRDLAGGTNNNVLETGVATLRRDIPHDDGFLDASFTDINGFNPPPLVEAADTAPLFHNNAAADVEAAVAFYVSDAFRNSREGQNIIIELTAAEQADIAACLRVLNAAENIRQVRKRAEFVRRTRSSGNTAILTMALADTADALQVLSAKGLNAAAQARLREARTLLNRAKNAADASRPALMEQVVAELNAARRDLLAENPRDQFGAPASPTTLPGDVRGTARRPARPARQTGGEAGEPRRPSWGGDCQKPGLKLNCQTQPRPARLRGRA